MRKHPWYKHDANDWLSDPLLRQCTLAAQGLLERLMCMCHGGDPYGHLILSGRVLDCSDISVECGKRPTSVHKLVVELEKHGRISFGSRQEVVINRMVKDRAYSLQQSGFGKDGGNPTLKAPLKVEESKSKSKNKSKRAASADALPEWLTREPGFSVELWGAWMDTRKKKRAETSGHAVDLLLKKLEQRKPDAIKAIEMAVENGWTGIEWEWFDNRKNGGSKGTRGAKLINTHHAKQRDETMHKDF